MNSLICLFVEDEPGFYEYFRPIIEKHFFKCFHFKTFKEAIEFFECEKVNVDFLLLDYRIPEDKQYKFDDVLAIGYKNNSKIKFCLYSAYGGIRSIREELRPIFKDRVDEYVFDKKHLEENYEIIFREIISFS